MKKIYLFFTLTIVSITSAQIQSQDFEDSVLPSGWTANIVSGGLNWAFGSGVMPSGADFDTNAAIFDDDAAGGDELDNTVELLSPTIDLTNYTDLTLSFEYAIQDYAGSGYLNVDVWDGTAWVQVLTETEDTDPTLTFIDVTAYKNANFQVRFTYGDDQDWAWGAGVDNFSLSGTLSTKSFENSKFSVYPNPTADVVNINTTSELTKMTILDCNGKIVKVIADNTTKIDVSNLNSGTYFLTYDNEGKHYTNKIVRK
jgi:hypothetical protein